MTDDKITALAREYGEYAANSLDYDMCPDPDIRHRLVVTGHSEAAQSVLEWLLRRFCLVEKSKVEAVYNMTWNSWHHTLDMEIKEKNQYVLDVLHALFPEIAKEVEE